MYKEMLNAGETIRRFKTVIPAALLLLAQSAWAQPVAEDFEMVVYNDTPQGRRIAQGEWKEALAQDEKGTFQTFDNFNNRCVLLTMTSDFEDAEVACDAAVETRKMNSATTGQWRNAARRRIQKAMALTNRGVLRAVTGDVAGAKQDFETVVAGSSRSRAARANLGVLEARTTELADRVAAN